jgi:hypothetical protein
MGPARLYLVSDCTASYRLVLSSERAPYMKKKVVVKQRKLKSDHGHRRGRDTKTNRSIESRRQYDLNLNLNLNLNLVLSGERETISFYWANLSWLPLKTESECSLRNVMFLYERQEDG